MVGYPLKVSDHLEQLGNLCAVRITDTIAAKFYKICSEHILVPVGLFFLFPYIFGQLVRIQGKDFYAFLHGRNRKFAHFGSYSAAAFQRQRRRVKQALIQFDLPALFAALWQDACILAACFAAAAVVWWFTRFTVEEHDVCTRQGVLVRSHHRYSAKSISVVEIRRPLHCRLLGASYLTFYFKTRGTRCKVKLCLPRRAAEAAADALLTVENDVRVFAPAGFEKLAFVMLSANVLTSCLFLWLGAQRLTEWLGSDVRDKAFENFTKLESLFETVLPAGLALATAALFVIVSAAFAVSLLHTTGFRVCRTGGVILSRCGLLTKTERRILVSAVTSADVRVTPVARLLRRRPVYVTAGSFRGGDMPMMVYRAGADRAPQALVPRYEPAEGPMCRCARRSLPQFLWKPGTALAVSLALCGVALWALPGILPVLYVPVLASAGCLAQSAEGYFVEGMARQKGGALCVTYTRFFTRHEVCVMTPDVTYETFRHPVSVREGRSDFTVRLPCGIKCRARGVMHAAADRMPLPG